MDVVDEVELLERWRSGEEDAGGILIKRHYLSIRRFFDIRIPDEAEDLTQQTLLACMEGNTILRPGSSVRAYMFGIARNLLSKRHRSRERFARASRVVEAAGPGSALTPSGLLANTREHLLLLRAFHRLQSDDQAILQLFYWENMKGPAIAEALSISETSVTSRLWRARRRLASEVENTRSKPEVRQAVVNEIEDCFRSMLPTA